VAYRDEDVVRHSGMIREQLQPSSDSYVAAEGECADAWEEYMQRLNHLNSQMKKSSADEAARVWRAYVHAMYDGDEKAANERNLGPFPAKVFGVESVDNDAEFKEFMKDLLAKGKFRQVAKEWRAFEHVHDVPEGVAVFLVHLITKEWGNRETWKSAATFWDMYNDFTPGVAPYVEEVLGELPDPKAFHDWDEFKAANTKTLAKAVRKMFQDLRNYCLNEEPIEQQPPNEEKQEPLDQEPAKDEEKQEPLEHELPNKPDWTVEGPDGSFCPHGCDNCLKATETAKIGKVWCYTKTMPRKKPNARCKALLYSGTFEVGGNPYAYRYLCNP